MVKLLGMKFSPVSSHFYLECHYIPYYLALHCTALHFIRALLLIHRNTVVRLCSQSAECKSVFCVVLQSNSDRFLKQHWQVDLCTSQSNCVCMRKDY
jgi:hypothetical protein